MKNKGLLITLLSLIGLLIVGLVAVMILFMNGKLNFDNIKFMSGESTNLIFEENYETELHNIKIDADIYSIKFIHSEDEFAHVRIYSDNNKIKEVKNDGSKLDIQVREKNHISIFNFVTPVVYIELPANFVGEFNVTSDVGNIHIDEFDNASLKLSADVGNTKIKSINTIEADADVGNITIEKVKYAFIETNTGNIKINEVNNFKLEADTGNINIEKAYLESDSKIKTDTGNIKIKKTNDVYINAKADVGHTKVNNSNRKADIELNIKTDTGNIKVNY